jgi:hypothetical protein
LLFYLGGKILEADGQKRGLFGMTLELER